MDSKNFCLLVLVISSVCVFPGSESKDCISYCGNATGIRCPSGYKCEDWGCGTFCLRSGQYQPDDCPMVNCVDGNCPLGYKRDDEGCEGCTCANKEAIRIIEEEHYNGSGSRVAVHVSMWMAGVLTTWIILG